MKKRLDGNQIVKLLSHGIDAVELSELIELLPRQVTLAWTDDKGFNEDHTHFLKILPYKNLLENKEQWIVSYEEVMGKGTWLSVKDELIDALFGAVEYMIKQGKI